MRKWKEYKLGEVATFITDKVPTKNISIGDYISTENMIADKNGITMASNIPEIGTITKYNRGNVLVSNIRPYFKKIWFANKSGGCSNDVLCLKGNEKLLNNKYFYFLLSQDEFFDYVMLGSKGCKMPRGDKSHIMNWNILLPTITHQESIAEILSSLDDKINLLNRQSRTLELMAETIFKRYFINEAKEEWREGKLGDEFYITMGQSPLGESFNEEKIGIPMYQGNADFGFRFPKNRVFTIDPKRFAAKFDTLVSVRAPVGAQNMANEKCCIGRGVAAFRYKKKSLYYSYTYYKMMSLMEEIKQFNETGTVFGSICKSDFENLSIVIPDIESITCFQEMVEPIDDKIYNNQNQICTLTKLRDTLLPKLMNGEIVI